MPAPVRQDETRPLGGAALLAEDIPELLVEARRRTLTLIAGVSDDDLDRVHDPLMSPLGRPSVARATFRNWDHPQRRQLFAGFRCATDAQAARP